MSLYTKNTSRPIFISTSQVHTNLHTIRFLVPPGYPFAQLDCFWADPDLLLAHGATPQNAALNVIPETLQQGMWFSWHLESAWNPNRDTLSTWMNVVIDRLRQVR